MFTGREKIIYLDKESQIADRVDAARKVLRAKKIKPGQWYPYNGELREVLGVRYSTETGQVVLVLSSYERMAEYVDLYEFIGDAWVKPYLPHTPAARNSKTATKHPKNVAHERPQPSKASRSKARVTDIETGRRFKAPAGFGKGSYQTREDDRFRRAA